MKRDRGQSETLEGALTGLSQVEEPDERVAKPSFTAGEGDVVGAGHDEQLAMLEALEQLDVNRQSYGHTGLV